MGSGHLLNLVRQNSDMGWMKNGVNNGLVRDACFLRSLKNLTYALVRRYVSKRNKFESKLSMVHYYQSLLISVTLFLISPMIDVRLFPTVGVSYNIYVQQNITHTY